MSWKEGRRVASAHRLFKLCRTALVAGALATSLTVTDAAAQAPDEDWRTLTTEHFRVTFPAGMEAVGRRAGARAEVAYEELSHTFLVPGGGRVDLLVTDHVDASNGVAGVRPSRRIIVYAPPPMDGFQLSYYDDWLELVVAHELVHIFHLDYTDNPLGRLGRAVFGRADSEWPLFPGQSTPRWVIEGLATWYESQLTSAGRTKGTFHEMQIRTAVLEGRFERLDQAGGESPLWPAGNRPYLYGSLFFDHMAERYGDDRVTAFAEAVAGQWIPYRIDAAGRSAFGVSISDAWAEWTVELEAGYADLDTRLARLGPVSEPERLTKGARWGLYPAVSPDGTTLVYTRSDQRSDIQLRRMDPDGGRSSSLSRTNQLATFAWTPDGRLVVSQLERRGPYRAYADLYLMRLDGTSERLTHGARLIQPSVAPDGSWAVAVQEGGGTNRLVRVDLATGAVAPLVPLEPDVHWGFPRLSPDGRWIAVGKWEPDALQDIVILDTRGREVHRVARDRAVDQSPAWSPDSRWVVWSSDRTGIMNVLAAPVDPETGVTGDPVLLSNVRTGATFPSVDPSGRWLYFSGYHVDGWEVERLPFDPERAPPAPPTDARFTPPRGPAPPRGEAAGTVVGYSPWPTLLPHYWQPRYREAVVARGAPGTELLGFALGAETSGFDLVGRHSYAAYAQLFTTGGAAEGGVSYAYRGLGNPIFSVGAEQTWYAEQTFTVGTPAATQYVLRRERDLFGSVTLLDPHWRRTLSATLGGALVSASREQRDARLDRVPLDPRLRPDDRLAETSLVLRYSTSRSHAFQTGGDRGLDAAVGARTRRHLGLPSVDRGVVGVDGSFDELTGQAVGYVPLWRGGYATHVLAVRVAGGSAVGPGAELGRFLVGGASGRQEALTGFTLFGGHSVFLPVRGYEQGVRFGRYAWSASAEYRFPIALVNRGLGAWPLHVDRLAGSLFVDAANAWEPTPLGRPAVSAGAEVTTLILGWWDTPTLLRTGVAVPLVDGGGASVYLRVGLSY